MVTLLQTKLGACTCATVTTLDILIFSWIFTIIAMPVALHGIWPGAHVRRVLATGPVYTMFTWIFTFASFVASKLRRPAFSFGPSLLVTPIDTHMLPTATSPVPSVLNAPTNCLSATFPAVPVHQGAHFHQLSGCGSRCGWNIIHYM